VRGAAAAWLAAAGLACAAGPLPEPAPYAPSRHDYRAFRARNAELLEPNYLPFMAHSLPGAAGGERLVLCRFAAEDMPLPVYVRAPRIPDRLQNEFAPKERAAYVAAVGDALAMWERELEGLVRFRRVERARDAKLRLALLPERAPAPDPDLVVLGRAPLARACRARGAAPDGAILPVEFRVPELKIYLADEFGLLAAEQVESVALHEIGHGLGMRGHSPIPTDLMYAVVRDRVIVRELSAADVNSFVSLYHLPNGTPFASLPPGGPAPPPPPAAPEGEPQLELAPHVDPRLGFSWRPPRDWLRIETEKGVVAVDGVPWDYTASFQVIVQRYASVEEYLERYGGHYLGRGRVLENGRGLVSGRPALQAVVEDPEVERVEYLSFVETGDGRVVVVVADCPAALAREYRPWFEAALGSLRIWEAKAGGGGPP